METVNLEWVIQQTITRFKHNRSGDKPLVFVSVSPRVAQVPWSDASLKEFVRLFVYECLHSSDPDTAIELLLTCRTEIGDLNDVLSLQPNYWVQLRLSGCGLKYDKQTIEHMLRGLGYSCAEWVGTDHSEVRMGIFGTKFNPAAKMVVCLNCIGGVRKCDLLLPISEYRPPRRVGTQGRRSVAPRV